MKLTEEAAKDQIVNKYIHSVDGWGNWPCTAVGREQKTRNGNTKNGKTMTALQVFCNRQNMVKDHAIEIVTKMHDIHRESKLNEEEMVMARKQYRERRDKMKLAADKRLEKKREAAAEAIVEERRVNKEMFEQLECKHAASNVNEPVIK